MKHGIYFDNAATTQVDPHVIKAMEPFMDSRYGNASSLHSFGTDASDLLAECRSAISLHIGARPQELYFTSSGTESNNLALKGIAFAHASKGRHIIISSIEHDCVLNAAEWLSEQGFSITYLPVGETGVVDPDDVKKNIRPDTILVSVMHANNEIGTIQPISEIGRICREHNVLLHTDACQSFGKIPVNVTEMNVDLMTLNSHKIYGPKGVGAIYIRDGIPITPLLHGGGQEKGIRSSTENVAGIAGFAKAVELCFDHPYDEYDSVKKIRDYIMDGLLGKYENAYINGDVEKRLPGNLNAAFHGLEGETVRLLLLLDEAGIAVSAGSACSSNGSGSHTSHVLQALGRDQFEARGAVRISIGRYNTMEEAEVFLPVLDEKLKLLNPIFS
ncbi:Cysteine desulfurase IscS [bioreactor metagenome]|uniref:Cysteine desulfurase IscS n=1 Tax=bioreactor metagenome TaxID=1076179 RepID=A0A644ZNQ9_9ZZZZ